MEKRNHYELRRKDLIYPELSYQIIGILFEIYRELGGGYQEKYYQKIVAMELKKCGLIFKEQVGTPLMYKGDKIGRYYLDFVIENKLVLELKRGKEFSRKHIEQVYAYLRATGLQLGIIATFTISGVRFKRILNIG